MVIEVTAEGLDPEDVTVGDIMTRELVTVTEDTDFWDAIHEMRRHGVRRLPVVNASGGLEGILALDDALDLLSEALAGLAGLVSVEIDREKQSRQ